MDSIPGIVLKDVLVEVEGELLEEQRRKIKESIRGHLIGLRDTTRELERLKKEMKDKESKLAGITSKINAIKEENWSVLQEPKKKEGPEDAAH